MHIKTQVGYFTICTVQFYDQNRKWEKAGMPKYGTIVSDVEENILWDLCLYADTKNDAIKNHKSTINQAYQFQLNCLYK